MKPANFYAALFLLSFSTLVLEIVETRLLSVISWYHLAFFVISAAMFGMTAAAVWVYIRRDRFTSATLPNDLSRFAAAFAVTVGLSLCLQVSLAPAMVFSVSTAIVFAEMALAIAAPFFCAGVAITLALTRSPFPVGRVYAVDLAGAACGCLGVIAFLDWLDAPSVILLTGGLAAGASILFARSAIDPLPQIEGALAGALARPWAILVIMVVVAMANGLTLHGIQPILVKSTTERRDASLVYEKWNSFSRVTVQSPPPGERGRPHLWGPSPTLPADVLVETKNVVIDGLADTAMFRFDGDLKQIDFLAYDVTNLAYFLRPGERTAVIGVGSGRDVLSAWRFGSRDITGVELNPIVVGLLTRDDLFARFAGLASLPGVRLIVDEARSWFARTEDRFGIIQMSMIDTWAATGAGAFTLSENGLYTEEAWRRFLDRLSDRGVFTVSRWYGSGAVNETGRMVSLAVAALLDSGAERPADHIFLAASGQVATLVLSRQALTPGDVQILRQACARYEYSVLLSPQGDPASEILAGIVRSGGRDALQRYTGALEFDLTPPTDDRPFFFNLLPFDRPQQVLRYFSSYRGVAGGNVTATLTLATILLVSVVLVAVTILLPLRGAVRHAGTGLVLGGTLYFALLGLGFMLVEIGFLQRLSVFLGHPVYSLSVVLFSLILSTGLGSLLSESLRLEVGRGRLVLWSALLGGYLLSAPYWLSSAIAAAQGAHILARAATTVAMITPVGVMLGFGFPTGLRIVQAIDPRPTPWFWGINGAAGVLGSVLAVSVSIAFGISMTLRLGALCYAVLIPVSLALTSKAAPMADHRAR
ncbi:MAG: hypothetical protein AUI47_03415 [Acidobacteria bacterium 13_1_40CM_2_68_5]|nr:MAG: hypothetical protein AUI47_03415 [Acidobacteria bacterium 13_1_40CM_2_68_5]